MGLPIIPLIYFIVCGILSIILWIKMLAILDSKGEKIKYALLTPTHYFKFLKLIKQETDTRDKLKYKKIFWIQILMIPVFIIGLLITIALTV
jgi:hypothetical protein